MPRLLTTASLTAALCTAGALLGALPSAVASTTTSLAAAQPCRIVDAMALQPGDRILGPHGAETVTDCSEPDGWGGVSIYTDNDQGGYCTSLPCPVKVLN